MLVLHGPNNSDRSAHAVWASNTAEYPDAGSKFGCDGLWINDKSGNPIWHNGYRAYVDPGSIQPIPSGGATICRVMIGSAGYAAVRPGLC
jgi:hypothetical protein